MRLFLLKLGRNKGHFIDVLLDLFSCSQLVSITVGKFSILRSAPENLSVKQRVSFPEDILK